MRPEHWLYTIPLRLRSLFRRKRVEKELDDEMGFHLERKTEEYVAKGLSPEEAHYAALRDIDGIEQRKEECRDTRRVKYIEDLVQDLRYALRMLSRSPGFTAVVVLTLALGIGANTAIFSAINAVLLRLLPVHHPRQLVEMRRLIPSQGGPGAGSFSYPAFERFRDHNEVFAGILAASATQLHGRLDSDAQEVEGQLVSGGFYSVLGLRAAIGRMIAAEDDKAGAPPVAVISYGYWQRAFGGEASALGRQLLVEGKPFTIIGVTAPGFSGLDAGAPKDFAVPMALEPQLRPRSWLPQTSFNWLNVVGRLKPGVSFAEAQTNLNVVFKQFLDESAAAVQDAQIARLLRSQVIQIHGAGSGLSRLRIQYSKPLFILMAAVGAVLLIACVNIANLLLARAATRRKELGMRLALGASRARLVFQLLTETVLLSLLGAALGLAFARWAGVFLVGLLSAGRSPAKLDLHPDLMVLGFTVGVCLLGTLICGLVPALQATRIDPGPALKESSGTVGDRPGGRLRAAFIVSQVALSLILLVGTGLFVFTLRNLEILDPGFLRKDVLLVGINPGKAGYKDSRLLTYYEQLLERLQHAPGVRAASLSFLTPISGSQVDLPAYVEGYAARPSEDTTVFIHSVSAGYFETFGTPVLLGRDFNVRDGGPEAPRVLLINEAMARDFFPSTNPIGRHVRLGDLPPAEIIGVVRDAKYVNLRDPAPRTAYTNCLQGAPLRGSLTLEIQSVGDAAAAVAAARGALQALDAHVSVGAFQTLAKQVDESLVQERLMATLSSLFGGLAVAMACIGLYGVLAYAVTRRTREIGIRMALGAQRSTVAHMVLRETLLLVGIGAAIGIPAALGLGRYVASLLYGLKASDPLTLMCAVALLFAVAALASSIPARRAARVDPMVALRYE